MNDLLSRIECAALRGFAIIGIVMHNFLHWLPGMAEENEFRYSVENVDFFSQILMHSNSGLPLHILSYYGHYGVSIFLFLSAYGLVRKYEVSDDDNLPVFGFIRKHYLKLFKIMIIGYALMMIWNLNEGGDEWQITHIASQLLMVINFAQYPGDIIWPGPYWYFGLMLQLYILYRLIFYRRHWGCVAGAMILCTVIQMFCYPDGCVLDWMRYNFIGSMLPFGFGLIYARYGKSIGSKWYILAMVVSLILLVVSGFNFYSWFFSPIFFIIFFLSVIKLLPQIINKGLSYIGLISSGLFVFHPIARKYFIYTAQQGDVGYGLSMYVTFSVIGAIILYFLWKGIDACITRFFTKRNT